MKERDKALSQYKKYKTTQNWEYYRELRNFAKSAIRREKSAYLKFLYENKNTSELQKAFEDLNI